MTQVRAIFCRSRNRLSSLALRTVMWSSWSHVATLVPGPDGRTDRVIDATFLHGVTQRPLADVIASSSAYSFREWAVPDAEAGYTFLRAQLGKPYDTLGVAGIGLHREWQRDDAWFCSELHERFLEACGLRRFAYQPNRVTPQLAWMVA